MLVALVAMSAVSCAEKDAAVEEGLAKESVSFYAEFANGTRTDLVYDETNKVWNTIWEGNETIRVVDLETNKEYKFTNTTAEPNKFSCTEAGVSSLLGKSVSADIGSINMSMEGKRGVSAIAEIDSFGEAMNVELVANCAFFRYTYNGEGRVTLSLTYENPEYLSFLCDGENSNSVEFSGIKGENWVAFNTFDDDAVLSYSIDGVKCKEKTITVADGKVYNLGSLVDPVLTKVYLVPSADWKQAGAWFAAHFFNSIDGYADVELTDDNGDGVYECSVPSGMEKVIFCRMNPAFTEFGWNVDGEEVQHVWNQIAVETIGVEPDNYFYVTDWAKGVWGTKDGYEEPEVNLGVIGFGGDWATDIDMTLEGEYYVLKGKEILATDSFKIRANDAWDESYGVESENEDNPIDADKVYTLVQGGKNMMVPAGVYDLYFNYAKKEFEAKRVGNLETQETPGQPSAWSLTGEFNGWGDAEMVTTEVKNLFVVKSVSMEAYKKFKVRKDKKWDENYGGGVSYINPNSWVQVYSNGSDVYVTEAGTYDFYFDYAAKVLYVVTAGGDYTAAAKQTTDGAAPDLSGASWGLCGAHNSWGSTADTKLTWDGTLGLYVAKSATLSGEFKVRADNSWSTKNYGSGGSVTVNASKGTKVYAGGGNSQVASGTYDVYFDLAGEQIWVKTVGSDAPTK